MPWFPISLSPGGHPTRCVACLGVGPRDVDLANIRIEPERLPNGSGGIHDVVAASPMGVALVHDPCPHGPPALRCNADSLTAPLPSRVPPRGQRHNQLVIVVEIAITQCCTAAILTSLETVHRHHSRGAVAVVVAMRWLAVPPGCGA
jgi:hypothetical protein